MVFRGLWPRRGSNPQPSGYPDRESDALATAPREYSMSWVKKSITAFFLLRSDIVLNSAVYYVNMVRENRIKRKYLYIVVVFKFTIPDSGNDA